LEAFAAIGGAEALAPVVAAMDDRDETVRNAAVSTLASWPNSWPEDTEVAEPLLALARSGKTTAYQVQGVRGYLQYIRETKQLGTDQKLAEITKLRPLLKRPEEKRLAIAAVSAVPSAAGLEMLKSFAADDSVTEEAYLGLVQVASKPVPGVSSESRRQTLEMVIEQSKNNATKRQARGALRRIH
jgi:HEAT repeat protein